jgi:hypothetical protein
MITFQSGEITRLQRKLSIHGFALLMWLRDQHGGTAPFEVADALVVDAIGQARPDRKLPMNRKRLIAARRELVEAGHIVLHKASNGWHAALYHWGQGQVTKPAPR